MDQSSLAKLLDHLDASPVECDGMARLVVTCLDAAGIPYRAMCGKITSGLQRVEPHLWVEVGPYRIDYRARMWLGDDNVIPHGVFLANQAGDVSYQGVEIEINPLSPLLFDILQMQIPKPRSLGLG